jgi:WD40 repeat protein
VTDALPLLCDCERFTHEFFSVISISSLQVYHSALLFTPKESLIQKTFGKELYAPMKVYNATDRAWDLCIRTMEGHTGRVFSVTFSPDGTCVVSGSSDRTLRLWDTVSGALLGTLKGLNIGVDLSALSINSFQSSFARGATITSSRPDSIFCHITEDGWIYSFTLQRRVC